MKLHHLFTAGLFAAFFMTSCSDDAFVENVLPEPITHEHAYNDRAAGQVSLNASQRVFIVAPPCNTGKELQQAPETASDNPEKQQPCYGVYGLAGSGSMGVNPELGPITSDFSMTYDQQTGKMQGTITLTVENGDMLVLKAIGESWKIDTTEGTELVNTVVYAKGTGEFHNSSFKGDLRVMQIDQIFDTDHSEYPVQIIVTGSLYR